MALSFQTTMPEEESHTRSRSMETSLRMRLDNGIPLTPKLLGYTHNRDGNLTINKDEAHTVKLAFYMYLYGYSTQQIADALITLGRRSYLGNIKLTAGGIVQLLRNERHCGDVITRKKYTPNYHTHLSKRNNGDGPQSHYKNHHEAIICRDDYIAVQRMLYNATILNIEAGSVIPTVSKSDEVWDMNDDLDINDFQVVRKEFFAHLREPSITFNDCKFYVNAACLSKFQNSDYAQVLVNRSQKILTLLPCDEAARDSFPWCNTVNGKKKTRPITCKLFFAKIFSLLDWNPEYRYKLLGKLIHSKSKYMIAFDLKATEVYQNHSRKERRYQESPYSLPSGKINSD